MSILEKLWNGTHPSWINWFRVPHWLYWLSFRPRRCSFCVEWYWGCWYTEFCSQECNDENTRKVDKEYGDK